MDQLYKFHNCVIQNEGLLKKENEDMKSLVEDLSHMVLTHKGRIDKLVHISKQQDDLLFTQSALLKRKVGYN